MDLQRLWRRILARPAQPSKLTVDWSDPNYPLAVLFESHGVPCKIVDRMIYPAASDVSIQANVWKDAWPERQTLQLDIIVFLGNGETLIESFAGFGDTREAALKWAFEAFCRGTLHVLLHAFWPAANCVVSRCDDLVDIETWKIGGGPWTVISGPMFLRHSQGSTLVFQPALHPTVKASVEALSPVSDTIWVRAFVANIGNGDRSTEVLLNNDDWDDANVALAALSWEPSDHYYSCRHFLIAKRLSNVME
jgi:hypothetical protein